MVRCVLLMMLVFAVMVTIEARPSGVSVADGSVQEAKPSFYMGGRFKTFSNWLENRKSGQLIAIRRPNRLGGNILG